MAMETVGVTCDICGFDGDRWSETDLVRTLARADDLIAHAVAGGAVVSDLDTARLRTGDPSAGAHVLMHHLADLARRRREGEVFGRMVGRIESIQRSGGGVPKLSVTEAVVDVGGIVGDGQAHRQHHGRPWQALCVYSADVIGALRAEGHPIGAGRAGENLTISGIEWSRLRGGLTLTVGDVSACLVCPADPCSNIVACFRDADWSRIDHQMHPGWSRWYASVIAGGVIRPGDSVTVTA